MQPTSRRRRAAVIRAAVLEALESRVVMAAGLEISEFVASNSSGLKDKFDDRPDWIEVHNNSPANINLDGYYLTDDPEELNLWRFPAVTLQPDEYLVVFASEKDLRVAGQELHTNFKLGQEGEYLAIVEPDGATVVDDYQPTPQITDFSYGVLVQTQSTPLITASAQPRVRVPDVTDAGSNWTGTNYNDIAWQVGPQPVGYDNDPAPPPGTPGIAVKFIDTSSGSFADVSIATRLLDGNTSGFTIASTHNVTAPYIDYLAGGRYTNAVSLPNGATSATSTSDPLREQYAMRIIAYVEIPAGTYTIGFNSDDGFRLRIPGVTFTNRVSENYQGIATAPDTLAYSAPRGASDTLGTFTVGAGGLKTTLTVDYYEAGGGDSSEMHIASGLRTSWSAANFSLFQHGAFGWGVYTSAPAPHYGSVIGTNVKNQMLNVNAGAYLRLPFNLENAADFDALRLRVKYDDGFAAYINGHPLVSRNAPGAPVWDSTATAGHDDTAALVDETINIPGVAAYLNEGVNVLAIHALNQSAGDADFLIAAELDGVRTLSTELSYFSTPTPGQINSSATLGKVTDTRFSKDRGFYDQPFPVSITTTTSGAQIRYTLDGSAPTATTGLVYSSPITINKTTVLRAAAFKAGHTPSDVDTQTYIFLTEILTQPNTAPAGYPTTWNGFAADYGMDPDIVSNPLYSAQMMDAMTQIPTLSLSLAPNDMFGTSTGIYVNSGAQGVAWERPASAELIYPDGRDGFQINAGLRMQGGAGRSPSISLKHSFRLVFSARTGPTKLEFPLFDGSRVDEFDTVTLRAGFNKSYVIGGNRDGERSQAQYTHDEFIRVAQRDMGQVSGYGNFVHLYINGIYWGLYNPTERPSAPMVADWYGGDKEDWDALNSSEAIDGDKNAWTTLQNLVNGPGGATTPTLNWLADDANYAAVKEYLDVENFIDYMLLNIWGGNGDWDDHNWYAARRRAPGEGYKFFAWDSERTLEGTTTDRTEVNQADKPSRIYRQLRANADFRILFADRLHKHFFNGGALTTAENQKRLMALNAQIDEAIIAESARWGDLYREPPYTKNVEWIAEQNRILNSYFPVRTTNVLNQFRSDGLYPAVNAPVFNQFGGTVAAGFNLTMSVSGTSAGTIYYTLDGSDPRLPGGAVKPSALVYAGPVGLSSETRVQARFLSGTNWSALDDAVFFRATPPGVRVSEIMYHPADGPVGSVFTKDDYEYVEVMNTGAASLHLGGMRLANGVNFTFPAINLAPGERTVVVRNPTAFQSRYGTNIATAGVYTDQLNNAGDTIRLETPLGQVIQEFEYDDEWFSQTDGGGYSLVAIDAMAGGVILGSKDGWRASTPAQGAPGLVDPGINNNAVVINEILPRAGSGDSNGDWIELRNTTGAAIDIGGWFLSDSAANLSKYQIAGGTIIPANGFITLSADTHFDNPADPGATTPFTLADNGGAVFLTGNDGAGSLSGYRDSVDYGIAETSVTFGRHIKSTGRSDFVALTTTTENAANSAPRVGPVVINEISYNPTSFGIEFIELHNPTAAAVQLWDAAHPENTWRIIDGIEFTFPQNVTIPAGGYIIIAASTPAAFRAAYPSTPASVQVFGPFVGNLDNAGESVELARPGEHDAQSTVPYIRVDKVTYDNDAPWPASPNGDGPTLSRVAALSYGNDGANWAAYAGTGSPGYVNFDNVAPAVHSFGFAWQTSPQQLTIQFNESVETSIALADFSIINALTNGVITPAGFAYDPLAHTATITFTGVLADGRYRVTLNGIADLHGNALAAGVTHNFFMLAGDFNHDAKADHADFAILHANFGQSGRDHAQGDFNFDGAVNFTDFQMLERNFGTQLAPLPAPAVAKPVKKAPVPAKKELFSTTPVAKKPVARKQPARR